METLEHAPPQETQQQNQKSPITKENLMGFLNRYYLDGEIERTRVSYSHDTQVLTTSFRSTDESIVGTVDLKAFPFHRDFDVAIHDTTRLKKLIGILEQDIDMELEWVHEPVSIYFTDDFKKVRYILGNKVAISKVSGEPNADIDWNIEFDLEPTFVSNFKSGVKALEHGSFAIDTSDDGRMKIVLGYMNRGSNNSVNLYPDPDTFNFSPKPNKPLVFNGKRCTKMFSANDGSVESRCQISSDMEIMKMTFSNDQFNSTYYMSAINPGNM